MIVMSVVSSGLRIFRTRSPAHSPSIEASVSAPNLNVQDETCRVCPACWAARERNSRSTSIFDVKFASASATISSDFGVPLIVSLHTCSGSGGCGHGNATAEELLLSSPALPLSLPNVADGVAHPYLITTKIRSLA